MLTRITIGVTPTIEPRNGPNRGEALDLNLPVKGKDPMDTLAIFGLFVILLPAIILGCIATVVLLIEASVDGSIGQ